MTLKDNIGELVTEKIAATDLYLVEVKTSPGKIAVIVDAPRGVKLDDCVQINRFLHEKLDGDPMFDKCELEVGSPGMEEPLKILPQYIKRIGQRLSVLTFDGLKRQGMLVNADENGIEFVEEVTTGSKKNKEVIKTNKRIPFNDIKEAIVIFSFDKMI